MSDQRPIQNGAEDSPRFREPGDAPALSVVVAAVDARRSIVHALEAIERTCRGLQAEMIVVDASRDGTADLVAARLPHVPLVRRPPGTLTPVLWAEGWRRVRGRVVAFTTGHCIPDDRWATTLLARIEEGATGAGGPFTLADGTGPVDWAVFYLRYSAFVPERLRDGRVEGEIAGDNAAYRNDALQQHADLIEHGFWEVEFHEAIRHQAAAWLTADRGALVRFGPSFPLRTFVRHRFAHGFHFGASRVQIGGRNRWRLVAASPLVPLLLVFRTVGRTVGLRAHWWRVLCALPILTLFASAWALGEAAGAIAAARPERQS